MQTKVSIRWWIRRDNPQVFAIEALNHGKHAEDEKYFLDILREATVIGCVAEKADVILGFMMYELFKNRLDILHFEVHPEWQRSGIGTQMFSNLVAKCQDKGREAITWKINERNLIVQQFLRKMGAKCTKLIRNFFENSGEDAFLFEFLVEKKPKTKKELEL